VQNIAKWLHFFYVCSEYYSSTREGENGTANTLPDESSVCHLRDRKIFFFIDLLYKIFNLLVTLEEEGKFMRFLLP
jgi:hypothetical protein